MFTCCSSLIVGAFTISILNPELVGVEALRVARVAIGVDCVDFVPGPTEATCVVFVTGEGVAFAVAAWSLVLVLLFGTRCAPPFMPNRAPSPLLRFIPLVFADDEVEFVAIVELFVEVAKLGESSMLLVGDGVAAVCSETCVPMPVKECLEEDEGPDVMMEGVETERDFVALVLSPCVDER